MRRPALSVVIPTNERPHFLYRAIASALESAPNGEVEVIVVPNGPGESWQQVMHSFKDDFRVHWSPIATLHANAARNHGASLASGRYIRFLDDDDFFYPKEAREQLENLINTNAQISQGHVALVTDSEKIIKKELACIGVDFTASILSSSRLTLPCSFIFSDSVAKRILWDVSRDYSQDVAYALSIAANLECSAVSFPKTVGAWTQHTGPRISNSVKLKEHPKAWANLLLTAVTHLGDRGALSKQRQDAALEGIWQCIHIAFPLDPLYWTSFVSKAPSFIKSGRPGDKLFELPLIKNLNPIYVEWLMFPHRRLRHISRNWNSP